MPGSLFPTTRRSVIEALRSEDRAERGRAFETVAAIYWKPLYKYARIVLKRERADAEDLTQILLLHALERDTLASYDSERASFRTFLRVLFDRLAVNHDKSAARIKRGGGAAHLDLAAAENELALEKHDAGNPEEYFHRQWVKSLFSMAIERCRDEVDPLTFAIFESYDLSPVSEITYSQLAREHRVSEATVTNRLAAARRRFREISLELLRDITASDHEFRTEARVLFGVEL